MKKTEVQNAKNGVKDIALSMLVTAVTALVLMLAQTSAQATTMEIQLTQPVIQSSPYHKPYVAIWLETEKREGVATLALWYQTHSDGKKSDKGKKWLKDLRQWWRKLGRADSETSLLDGYSGATKTPKTYKIAWNGKDNKGKPVPAGTYWINVEAAREDGGRSYSRKKIDLAKAGAVTLAAEQEIGPVAIRWK